MKSVLFFITSIMIASTAFLLNITSIQAQSPNQNQKEIYYFYGEGCGHCAKVNDFFNGIKAYEKYPISKNEVYFNRENAALLNDKLDSLNIPLAQRGVPTIIIGQEVLIGDKPIIDNFEPLAATYLNAPDSVSSINPKPLEHTTKDSVSLWLIIGAALVDAINPCAFAVLLILLTTILAQKNNQKRVLASGFAFTVAIFVSYLLMGLGVYTALSSIGTTNIITMIVGILAIILGLFNLKDWLWYGKTAPMEVPMSWRPKMAAVIERVTSPAGAILAGLIVSLFLLPCTSGPYIVVLGLLAENPGDLGLLSYLVIYNLVFVLPMIIITLLVAFGLKVDTVARLREQHIDKLHLIAGVILVALGAFVLITL